MEKATSGLLVYAVCCGSMYSGRQYTPCGICGRFIAGVTRDGADTGVASPPALHFERDVFIP